MKRPATLIVFLLPPLAPVWGCAAEDDDGTATSSASSSPGPGPAGSGPTDDDGHDEPSDDGSSGDPPDDDPEGIECTFPNEISVCGCGNACIGDGPDYGMCESCGPGGAGCARDDIWCCSDDHCPTGTQCSTLSQNPSVGYHLCTPLEPCDSDDDCFGEPCEQGYCRDQL